MRKWVMPSCADRWRRVRKYFPLVSEKAFHSNLTAILTKINSIVKNGLINSTENIYEDCSLVMKNAIQN